MSTDQDFMAFASQFEQEENARNSRSGGGFTPNYEELKWTGLEPSKMKIVRALGGVPDKNPDSKTDARTVQVAWITGDDGKRFRSILPPREEGKDHLMWRIISRVKEVAYVNRKRVYVNEEKHKEIFDLIVHNGLKEGDPKRRFNRGWEGRHVIVMNVLDREQMDWHKENKHSMLLSRNIGEGQNGALFIDEGVPVFGFYNQIATTLFANYGSWEKYDMGILRTGQQQTPYRIINATAYAAGNIPELPAALKPYVVLGPLTEEELSWDRYDLKKIFGTTSYTKYYNRLKVAIQTIDARLGTKFFKELEYEVEKEKAEREARQAEASDDEDGGDYDEQPVTTKVTTTVPAQTAAPVRTREAAKPAPAATGLSADKIALLKGWNKISPEQQAMIVDVKVLNGKIVEIMYDTDEPLVACPDCKIASPESFTACPACGLDFT
jgi:hypothetical protein